MTLEEVAEEKAQYLFSLYRTMLSGIGLKSEVKDERAKQCAMVMVDEMIENTPMYTGGINPQWEKWQAISKKLETF